MKITSTKTASLFVLLFAWSGCESAEERRERLIDEGRACDEGDTCVLAGGSDCTCAVPVNEEHAAEIDAAADAIACCDLLGRCVAVDCAAFQDIRCENGECVGD